MDYVFVKKAGFQFDFSDTGFRQWFALAIKQEGAEVVDLQSVSRATQDNVLGDRSISLPQRLYLLQSLRAGNFAIDTKVEKMAPKVDEFFDCIVGNGTDEERLEKLLRSLTPEEFPLFAQLVERHFSAEGKNLGELLRGELSSRELGRMLGIVQTAVPPKEGPKSELHLKHDHLKAMEEKGLQNTKAYHKLEAEIKATYLKRLMPVAGRGEFVRLNADQLEGANNYLLSALSAAARALDTVEEVNGVLTAYSMREYGLVGNLIEDLRQDGIPRAYLKALHQLKENLFHIIREIGRGNFSLDLAALNSTSAAVFREVIIYRAQENEGNVALDMALEAAVSASKTVAISSAAILTGGYAAAAAPAVLGVGVLVGGAAGTGMGVAMNLEEAAVRGNLADAGFGAMVHASATEGFSSALSLGVGGMVAKGARAMAGIEGAGKAVGVAANVAKHPISQQVVINETIAAANTGLRGNIDDYTPVDVLVSGVSGAVGGGVVDRYLKGASNLVAEMGRESFENIAEAHFEDGDISTEVVIGAVAGALSELGGSVGKMIETKGTQGSSLYNIQVPKIGQLEPSQDLTPDLTPDSPDREGLFTAPDEEGATTKVEREIIPGFTLEHLGELFQEHGTGKVLQEGDTLMEKGDVGDRMFWIVEGTLTVHVGEKTIELGPGNVVGEMALFGESKIRSATVTAKTGVKLLELTDQQIRHLVTAGTIKGLKALTDDRKKVWPALPVNGDEVRLINLDAKYIPLVELLLTNEKIRNEILQSAGIDPTRQEVHIQDAMFGGEGSIKYVVRLGLTVDGQARSLGIRFYGSRLFRSSDQANDAARQEVKEFQDFQEVNGTALVIHKYIAANELGERELPFLMAGISGFSIGEFIVPKSLSDVPGDTGVQKEHLQDTVETVIRGWFLRRGTNDKYTAFGPVIGDLKLENFVLDEEGERGQKIKYIDLGDVQWVDFPNLVLSRLADFLNEHLSELSPAEQARVLADGLTQGVLGYVKDKIVSITLSPQEKIKKLKTVIDTIKLIESDGDALAEASRRIIAECEKHLAKLEKGEGDQELTPKERDVATIERELKNYGESRKLRGLEGRIQRGLDPAGMLAVSETREKVEQVAAALGAKMEDVEKLTNELHVGGIWGNAERLAKGDDPAVKVWMVLGEATVSGKVKEGDLTHADFLRDTERVIRELDNAASDTEGYAQLSQHNLIERSREQFKMDDDVPISQLDNGFLAMAVNGHKSGIVQADNGLLFVGANELNYTVLEKMGLKAEEREDRGRKALFYVNAQGEPVVKKLYPGFAIVLNKDLEVAKALAREEKPAKAVAPAEPAAELVGAIEGRPISGIERQSRIAEEDRALSRSPDNRKARMLDYIRRGCLTEDVEILPDLVAIAPKLLESGLVDFTADAYNETEARKALVGEFTRIEVAMAQDDGQIRAVLAKHGLSPKTNGGLYLDKSFSEKITSALAKFRKPKSPQSRLSDADHEKRQRQDLEKTLGAMLDGNVSALSAAYDQDPSVLNIDSSAWDLNPVSKFVLDHRPKNGFVKTPKLSEYRGPVLDAPPHFVDQKPRPGLAFVARDKAPSFLGGMILDGNFGYDEQGHLVLPKDKIIIDHHDKFDTKTHDTSVLMAFRFIEDPAQMVRLEDPAYLDENGQLTVMTNNIDSDSIISTWVLVNRQRLLDMKTSDPKGYAKLKSLLFEITRAGDFLLGGGVHQYGATARDYEYILRGYLDACRQQIRGEGRGVKLAGELEQVRLDLEKAKAALDQVETAISERKKEPDAQEIEKAMALARSGKAPDGSAMTKGDQVAALKQLSQQMRQLLGELETQRKPLADQVQSLQQRNASLKKSIEKHQTGKTEPRLSLDENLQLLSHIHEVLEGIVTNPFKYQRYLREARAAEGRAIEQMDAAYHAGAIEITPDSQDPDILIVRPGAAEEAIPRMDSLDGEYFFYRGRQDFNRKLIVKFEKNSFMMAINSQNMKWLANYDFNDLIDTLRGKEAVAIEAWIAEKENRLATPGSEKDKSKLRAQLEGEIKTLEADRERNAKGQLWRSRTQMIFAFRTYLPETYVLDVIRAWNNASLQSRKTPVALTLTEYFGTKIDLGESFEKLTDAARRDASRNHGIARLVEMKADDLHITVIDHKEIADLGERLFAEAASKNPAFATLSKGQQRDKKRELVKARLAEVLAETGTDMAKTQPTVTGLGKVSGVEGQTVYFATVEWPDAQKIREKMGLKPKDFHITLASTASEIDKKTGQPTGQPKDVHDVEKKPNDGNSSGWISRLI